MGIFKRKSVKVAVIQTHLVLNEKEDNIRNALCLVDKAIAQGAKLICLPEVFASGINFMNVREMAEPIPEGPATNLLSEKAKSNQIYIVAGVLEKDSSGDIYDSAILLCPDGKLLGKYRRWFLWHGERNYISQGKAGHCIQTEIGKIGLLVGYDISFPEACRQYFEEQVDILICVATIFEELSYATQQLCRSRAVENHCYFIFASGLGEHPLANRYYMGNSMITCDPYFLVKQLRTKQTPDMEIVAKADKQEVILTQELFLEDLVKSRKEMPFHQDFKETIANSQKGNKSYAYMA